MHFPPAPAYISGYGGSILAITTIPPTGLRGRAVPPRNLAPGTSPRFLCACRRSLDFHSQFPLHFCWHDSSASYWVGGKENDHTFQNHGWLDGEHEPCGQCQ